MFHPSIIRYQRDPSDHTNNATTPSRCFLLTVLTSHGISCPSGHQQCGDREPGSVRGHACIRGQEAPGGQLPGGLHGDTGKHRDGIYAVLMQEQQCRMLLHDCILHLHLVIRSPYLNAPSLADVPAHHGQGGAAQEGSGPAFYHHGRKLRWKGKCHAQTMGGEWAHQSL